MMSPQGIGGDDRAGVYMILRLIQDLHCHVLFCEAEEIGGHGAKAFVQSGIVPEVNYIVEFDRMGSNDAVYYNCKMNSLSSISTGLAFRRHSGASATFPFWPRNLILLP